MTAGAPWSVKGIDPKAREVAKDLARRSGMTLGEWLNRVILEDDAPEEITREAEFAERPRRASHEPPRLRLLTGGPPPEDFSRVAYALDRLTDRIESSETRTGLAISGVEHSVRQALARIEAAEREHMAVAARIDGSAGEQAGLAERVKRLEAGVAGPRSAEALRLLEERVARVETRDPAAVEAMLRTLGDRLAGAEADTAGALDDLKRSLTALDRRVGEVDRGAHAGVERRFEALAQALTERVEQARAEVAEKLQASSAGQVEARLAEMSAHVAAAERRAAEALERMGKEVLNMAEALNRRLGTSEQRNAEAIEQVGGEIARIAGAVEARLSRGEHAQAEALERLGVEIGRITDRLSERLMNSERRAAEAIDAVGEQVARVTERIEQRHDRAAGDLSERIRQSEERTARMLEQARVRLEPGADQADQADEEPAALRGPFGPELFSRAEPDEGEPAAPGPPGNEASRLAFAAEDFEAADGFAPIPEPDDDVFLEPPRAASEPAPDPDAARPLSTREVIDQARAAARAAQAERPRTVEMRAKLDRREASGRLFNGFGMGVSKPRRGASALQTALMVAGGAAFLSVGAAGVVLMEGPRPEADGGQASPFGSNPRAAVAVAPSTTTGTAAEALTDVVPSGAEAAFAEAVRAVEAARPGGLAALKAVADGGYPPAQFYLAQLYETGGAGVVQNMTEARRWTARAAEGGERNAMHNLGLYFFRGEGGPQDLASAAQWFRKAASLGVVDSQYNLGLMYQSGSGVQQDLAEALKWFKLAAAQGDGSARTAVDTLKAQLPAAVVAQAEAAAAAEVAAHANTAPQRSADAR